MIKPIHSDGMGYSQTTTQSISNKNLNWVQKLKIK